ncbi:hypothetical protein VN12_13865 [Pirellula sp. SH-Sr6A]|uniref:CsbD family protein n=1 Tax=Pirellula sp. SH-Sr6A TaxID=1632865 RepID=UPI00078BEA94|nr:CsbD family protein [Pirellula sp. SH-Sr6A]AMV33208.1 hypothetical protein VN12_13865 [Pirellula sp. SH-Sr6A]
MVAQETLAGNWHKVVGAIKEKFGQITGDDLTRVQGNVDQLIGLIERKTGQTREQIEAFLTDCCDQAGSAYRKASHMIDEGINRVSEQADHGYQVAKDTVSKRPMESIAIVAGLGLLAGIAIGVSMASRK